MSFDLNVFVAFVITFVIIFVTSIDAVSYNYVHFPRRCVSGYNMKRVDDKSVRECKDFCDQIGACRGFEYGVAYGGGGTYPPRVCQLQSYDKFEDCDGSYHNLDLYIKGTEVTPMPSTSPITSYPTVAPMPDLVDVLHQRLLVLESALAGNTSEKVVKMEQLLEVVTDQLEEQNTLIADLQVALAKQTTISTELADQLKAIPGQFATVSNQIDLNEQTSAVGDDDLIEKLDSAATVSKSGNSWTSSSVPACTVGDCSTPLVQASVSDLVLQARQGSVSVVTKNCKQGVDICELAKLTSTLQAALAKLAMDDA